MKCPICGKTVAVLNPEMPFCSERCRTIDLGNWASEKYVFSSPIESSTDGEVVTRNDIDDDTHNDTRNETHSNQHDEHEDVQDIGRLASANQLVGISNLR